MSKLKTLFLWTVRCFRTQVLLLSPSAHLSSSIFRHTHAPSGFSCLIRPRAALHFSSRLWEFPARRSAKAPAESPLLHLLCSPASAVHAVWCLWTQPLGLVIWAQLILAVDKQAVVGETERFRVARNFLYKTCAERVRERRETFLLCIYLLETSYQALAIGSVLVSFCFWGSGGLEKLRVQRGIAKTWRRGIWPGRAAPEALALKCGFS